LALALDFWVHPFHGWKPIRSAEVQMIGFGNFLLLLHDVIMLHPHQEDQEV
jgi:hypothetical protein